MNAISDGMGPRDWILTVYPSGQRPLQSSIAIVEGVCGRSKKWIEGVG